MVFDVTSKRIFVAGHRGMVGAAVCRRLKQEDCDVVVASRDELDLTDQAAVREWIASANIDAIIMAAAKVGGILANSEYPVDFLQQNISIVSNLAESAHQANIDRFLFLGSSCIYPKFAEQPIKESSLLTGPLEPTNEWYAIAKIAGIKLMQAYRQQYGRDWISAMPTNLYGPGDNYDLQSSHVLPALIRKFHEAKVNETEQVEIWGSGKPFREFMHCDDLADALVYILKHYSEEEHINVGSGEEVSIRELANIVSEVIGSDAKVVFDTTKPDGTPRKLMDSSRLRDLGWHKSITIRNGIRDAYRDWIAD